MKDHAEDINWITPEPGDDEDIIFYRQKADGETEIVTHLTRDPQKWRTVDEDDNDLGPVSYTGPDENGWYTIGATT